jgi:hypothetical protein
MTRSRQSTARNSRVPKTSVTAALQKEHRASKLKTVHRERKARKASIASDFSVERHHRAVFNGNDIDAQLANDDAMMVQIAQDLDAVTYLALDLSDSDSEDCPSPYYDSILDYDSDSDEILINEIFNLKDVRHGYRQRL